MAHKGFTLIEILVVVLVIGILAAVALPKYQKAVFKSNAGQIISLIRSIADAQERFYLANGKYASDFESLDVDIAALQEYHYGKPSKQAGDWDVSMYCPGGGTSCESIEAAFGGDAENYTVKIAHYLIQKRGTNIYRNAGNMICIAGYKTEQKKKQGKEYCQAFGGTLIDSSDDRYFKLPF